MVQLTKTASSQYCGQGIRVNCVIPGWVDAPRSRDAASIPGIAEAYANGILVGRVGTPQDIARLILYLASDEASFVAGASIVIDGGHNAQ